MTPKVVLVFHNSPIRMLEQSYQHIHNIYGDDVLIMHSSGPTDIEVYGVDSAQGTNLVGVTTDLLEQLTYEEKQTIYENLNKAGHRIK